MTVTITKEKAWREDSRAFGVFKVTFDDSYPAGGEVIDLSPYFKSIYAVLPVNTEDAPAYVFVPDDTNFLTPATFKMEVFWAGYSVGTDGALVEVTATTDLQAVSVRLYVIGQAI